jgi:hypothetical protein
MSYDIFNFHFTAVDMTVLYELYTVRVPVRLITEWNLISATARKICLVCIACDSVNETESLSKRLIEGHEIIINETHIYAII